MTEIPTADPASARTGGRRMKPDRPYALTPPEEIDVDEFVRRLSAALAEVGCYAEIDGLRIRFREADEATVRKAQCVVLDSMRIPYEIGESA